MLECSRHASSTPVYAEDGDSETESDIRLPDSSDDPLSAVKSEVDDGSEFGDLLVLKMPEGEKAPSPLLAGAIPDAGPAVCDAMLLPPGAAHPALPQHPSSEDVFAVPGGTLQYENLPTQESGCLCDEVGSADNAVALLSLAAEDTVSALRFLPADISIGCQCEILCHIRTFNTYLRWVVSYQ